MTSNTFPAIYYNTFFYFFSNSVYHNTICDIGVIATIFFYIAYCFLSLPVTALCIEL